MAKKAKQPSADDILKQMYPDLLTSDDIAPKQETAPAATGADAKTIADLQSQLANLQGQLANVGRTNTALLSQAQTDMPPARPQVDFSKAPNPIDDPAGYAQFMFNASQSQIDYEKQAFQWQERQRQTASNKTAMLWKDFETNYKEYASQSERVEVAAQRVLNKAQAQGIDTDKYMYGSSTTFMQDVVAEMDRLFGKPQGATNDDVDDDDDGNDLRTDGIFGGAAASAQGGKSTTQEPPQRYGTLSRDIMAWQEKTGFHR